MWHKANLIPFILMVCVGCGVSKQVPQEVVRRDSTVIHYKDSIIVRDSLVYIDIPKESSHNTVPQNKVSYLTTSLAESTAYIDSVGFLYHTLNNLDKRKLEVFIPVKERIISSAVSSTNNMVITKTVTVEKQLTWWQKFRLKSFWWLSSIFVLQIIFVIFVLLKKF